MTRSQFQLYLVLTAIPTLLALWQAGSRPPALFQPSYWRWLLVPWKLATLAISLSVLAIAGPLTRDPYWDVGVTVLMSLLCFSTAPWVVGALARRESRLIALTTWFWSVSCSYDLYWYLRRGFHPDDWLSNLVISSFLYVGAGLLWNLDWSPERGIHLAFRQTHWPSASSRFRPVAVPVLALMILVGAILFVPYALVRP